MKKKLYYFSFLLVFISFSKIFADTDPQSFLKGQKLSFRENKGQIADKGKARNDIFFEAQGNGVKVYFTAKGLIYNYIQHEEVWFNKPASKIEQDKIRKEHPENIKHKSRAYGMQLLFEGANQNVKIRSEEETGEEANFYLAHCPDGVTGVKSFKKIIYENIYPNIDLIFYAADQGFGNIENISENYRDYIGSFTSAFTGGYTQGVSNFYITNSYFDLRPSSSFDDPYGTSRDSFLESFFKQSGKAFFSPNHK